MNKLNIGIDIAGSDHGYHSLLKAILDFSNQHKNYIFHVYGYNLNATDLQTIKLHGNVSYTECEQEITQKDDALAFRVKPNSSLVKMIQDAKDKNYDAVLSSASSSNFVTLCSLKFEKISWMKKVAFMPIMPLVNGEELFLLDVGATTSATSDTLVSFAIAASNLYETYFANKKPAIALLSNGTEETKGLDFVVEAHKDLKKNKHINFIGNIEARDILNGTANVIVCDGWSGNILLKSYEGAVTLLFKEIKKAVKLASVFTKLGMLIAKPALKGIATKYDYKKRGGAMVVGVDKICIKAHGSSDYESFKGALEQLDRFLSKNAIASLKAIKK